MKQIKRIDEYVSKLFADPTLDEAQMAIVLTAEGGDGIDESLYDNVKCSNKSADACGRFNYQCTNIYLQCGNSKNHGLCDNKGPEIITPGKNMCPIDKFEP